MRPIDADELHDELKKQPKWVVKRDGFTNEGYSYDQVHFTIDKIPTVEAEPTEEQVKEYCRKRDLIVVDGELFNEMKARWSAVPVVRCKDCKWRGGIGCAITIVDESDKPTDDDFCSWGERRENETN